MANKEQKNFSINKIRTTLLLMVNKELSALKKTHQTKINSKQIAEAENYYASMNNCIVQLKEEKFIPNFITSDVIHTKNIKNNFSFKSPDQSYNHFIRKIKNSSKNNIIIKSDGLEYHDTNFNNANKDKISRMEFQLELLGKKSDISTKKNEHFKKKTLRLDYKPPFLKSKIFSSIIFRLTINNK